MIFFLCYIKISYYIKFVIIFCFLFYYNFILVLTWLKEEKFL